MAFPDDDGRYGGQYCGPSKHGLPSWSSAEYKAVTPHDTNAIDATGPCIGLYVGVTGNITCKCPVTGIDELWENLAVGYHPIRTQYIRATGTTAGMKIKAMF